jgi:antitoxin ParD1/3/4
MPKRATMNISVPASIRDQMADRVSEGGYGSASEYVRELVREDLERHAMEHLERKLLEGIASGPAKPFTKADWKRLRADAARRIAAGRRARR